ncbi:fibroblast growth factor 9-like [Bacillus rossius redtenbacheri]|uniref:fibroblast growth factor 9-like n=1 Tax=Bacillus rossius redtenbacheri TaxID=93214 RepID=UPI002FDCC624
MNLLPARPARDQPRVTASSISSGPAARASRPPGRGEGACSPGVQGDSGRRAPPLACRQMEAGDAALERSSSSDGADSDQEDEADDAACEAAGGAEEHARNKRDVGETAYGKCECAEPRGGRHGAHLLPSHAGNPVYGPRMQLYCRTGFHLAILPNGKVRGSPDDFSKFAVMELSSVDISEVRIRAVETNLFLAMNNKGRLYGEKDVSEEGTIFVEMVSGQYNSYLSRKYAHLGWYLAIKRSGRPKNGRRTAWGQKSTQFLPRRT